MATVVAAIGTSHGPQLKTPSTRWAERGKADRLSSTLEFRGRRYTFDELKAAREDFAHECVADVQAERWTSCQQAMDHLAGHMAAAAVDVLVVVSNDQKEIFDDDLLPAFAVYWGDAVDHVPFTPEQIAAMPPGLGEAALGDVPEQAISRPCHSELARHLIASTMEEGFDLSASRGLPAGSYGNHGLPHGYGFVYQRIMGERSTVPLVPVFINTFYEPNPPSARRCLDFGRALGRALGSFPEDLRVGVVASGGLSHFVIDEDLDRDFLKALEAGDERYLASVPASLMRSGSSELRNWIAVTGIAAETGLSVSSVDYQPCYRTEAGTGNAMGFVTWSPDGAQAGR